MNVKQMREELLKVYSTPSWQSKVKYMTEAEVIAIHHRMSHNGLLKGKS